MKAGGGLQKDSLVAIETLNELGYEVHLSSLSPPKMERVKHNFNKDVRISSSTIPRFVSRSNRLNLIRSTIMPISPRVDADVYVNMMAHWFPLFEPSNPEKLIMYVGALPKFPVNANVHLISTLGKPVLMMLNFLGIRKLQKLLERATVLTASKYLQNALSDVWGIESKILYPAVDFHAYQATMEDIQRKDVNSMALLGRFHAFKNFETAISIAERLKDSQLRIIGAVQKESYFESIEGRIMRSSAKKRISSHLNMPVHIRADLLKRSKVFVHAAVGEGFGGAVVEAMAAGCIPVVHNSGGPSEYVPEKWRYDTLDDCLEKIEHAFDASPHEHMEMVKIAEEFREESYRQTFIQYLKKLS